MKAVIYDYDNRPTECDLGDKPIKLLLVEVVSGDEILVVCYKDGTKESYDSSLCRCADFSDGRYIVDDKKGIEKWLKWKPEEDSSCYSYDRQEAFEEYEV